MRNKYVQNGDFHENFAHWEPLDFKPVFAPHGQSIQLSANEIITQHLPDLPGQTLRIEFDVRSATTEKVAYAVSVAGIDEEGGTQVSPLPGIATEQWQRVTSRLYFQRPMTHCILQALAQEEGNVLFSRFSLYDE